ncbi:HipA N-terminal domain-containing protein [Lentisphaera araneosa]|nr:HipA N-terminal domain-containing protein [Lentisphaera araneosa]
MKALIMRRLEVSLHGELAGHLSEFNSSTYLFEYLSDYKGPPISRTMPCSVIRYKFDQFPPFFDGLLPEGAQLEYLLKSMKIDAHDYLSQLIAIGDDFVGAISIKELSE